MIKVENSPKRYYKAMQNYQEGQLLFAAIRLNIFTYLDTPQTAQSVAEAINCDKTQVELMLFSLVSCGLVNRQEEYYRNTAETREFLSRNSAVFLGDTLLFREKMTSLDQLEEKVQSVSAVNNMSYDFSELARLSIPEMYSGRVQAFMNEVNKLFSDSSAFLNILDLGGGAGILDVELIKRFPNGKATVMETPDVSEVTKEIVEKYDAEEKIQVISGDFNYDSLGGPYHMIIASGILNFVEGDLTEFIKKVSDALEDGGYLFIIGQFADDKKAIPSNMLSWLSGFLDGIPLPPGVNEIKAAMQKCGLTTVDMVKVAMFEGHIYQKGGIKSSVNSKDVISSFIELTEKISNAKTNILNFGSEDMTFYRGEIHMIKTIGDYPGIHSAELARKYGITRPVVHKTLQKLSERGLISKKDDPVDKKRYLLYLTEKGNAAYLAHEKYHDEYDQSLFDFLNDTSSADLAVINGFLEHAIGLIQNHS
jgi:DNA-binding MarR family transcriptional regulator